MAAKERNERKKGAPDLKAECLSPMPVMTEIVASRLDGLAAGGEESDTA